MFASAWQIASAPRGSWKDPSILANLHLNNTIPIPSAADIPPNNALVRIRAVGINARDMMVISHDSIYAVGGKEHTPNLSPCMDGAGEIVATGQNSIWKIGDRVVITPTGWDSEEAEGVPSLEASRGKGAGSVEGVLRQFAVLPDTDLLPLPPHLSFIEAASLPCAGGTAINALLFGPLKMKAGMTILTQGTGGVSCFAIQFGKALGLTVISTSSSEAKLMEARKLGAKHTINYRTTPAWDVAALALTGGKGVDHVIDVGGSSTIEKSLRAVRAGGVVTCIGMLGGLDRVNVLGDIIFGAKTLRGAFSISREHCVALLKLVAEQEIHPPVARVYEWADAKGAFEMAMSGEVVGKIVVSV